MGQAKTSYSLLFDEGNARSKDPGQRDTLKAHLIHALLMNERLVLSDSQVLTSRNFRILLGEEPVFLNYLTPETFQIAFRELGNTTLVSLNERFFEIGKLDPATHPSYRNAALLERLESRAARITWRYQDLANGYRDRMAAFFREGRFPAQFGARRGEELAESLDAFDAWRRTTPEFAESPKDVTMIGRDVFNGPFLEFMERQAAPLNDAELALTLDYSNAVYLSNMAMRLSADPIYDKAQARQIDLLGRPVGDKEAIGEEKRVRTTLDASRYVEGLIALQPTDVFALRDSREFKDFSRLKHRFSGTQHDCEQLEQAVQEYLVRIDELILLRAGYLSHSRTSSEIERRLRWDRYPEMDAVQTSGGELLSLVFAGLGLPVGAGIANWAFWFVVGKAAGRFARREVAAESEAARSEAFEDMKTGFETVGKTEPYAAEEIIGAKLHEFDRRTEIGATD